MAPRATLCPCVSYIWVSVSCVGKTKWSGGGRVGVDVLLSDSEGSEPSIRVEKSGQDSGLEPDSQEAPLFSFFCSNLTVKRQKHSLTLLCVTRFTLKIALVSFLVSLAVLKCCHYEVNGEIN